MPTGDASITVYADANLNIIDGSSVWTQSICLALAGVGGVRVTVLLNSAVENERLVGPLLEHPRITVIDPYAEGLATTETPQIGVDQAVGMLIDRRADGPEALLVRGIRVARRFAATPEFQGKLWAYLTDIPQHALDVDRQSERLMEEVGSASQVVLCQTEELRSFIEASFPAVAGKCRLLPPIIPDTVTRVTLDPPTPDDLRMVYAGKFARAWNTLEMCGIPERLVEHGVTASLTMIGDKINQAPGHPGFVDEMRAALENAKGVSWPGGKSHEESLQQMGEAHVGLSWRSQQLSDSLELSTKLLEYCAAGTPPIVNRTPVHETLFGTDYPLFAETERDVLDRLVALVEDPDLYRHLLEATKGLAQDYGTGNATTRLAQLVERLFDPERRQGEAKADDITDRLQTDSLIRAKAPGARFHIGMISPSPYDDDLDWALQVIEGVRERDPRFVLFIRSTLLADQSPDWEDVSMYAHWRRAMQRLSDPILAGGVVFDGPRASLAGWLRKIGFVLVTDDEVGPAAAGTVPVVRQSSGSRGDHPPSWVRSSVDDAAARILDIGSAIERWEGESAAAVSAITGEAENAWKPPDDR